MDHGGPARGVPLHTHPVAHTRQIADGPDVETELAREFRITLGVLIPDQEGIPVNGRNTRHAVSRLQEGGGLLLKPAVKA